MAVTDPIEERLRMELAPREIPPAEEEWAAVWRGIGARARRRRRAALLRVGLALLLALVVLTTTVGLAGSPEARARLWSAVSIGMGPGGTVRTLEPSPPFAVLQPTYLPEGMRLLADAYRPAEGSWTMEGGGAAFRKDDPPDGGLAEAARRRVRAVLDEEKGPLLVLAYAAPPDRLVELIERPDDGAALPPGAPTTLRGQPGARLRRDGRDVYAWVEGRTRTELRTTLPEAEARRVLDGLRSTPLEHPVYVPRPAVVALVPPPLPKSRTVEQPRVDPATLSAECGPWDAELYPARPNAAYEQIGCYGFAVSGVDRGGGWGISRVPWRQAAEEHGLGAAPGPAPESLVWTLTASARDGTGAVVVLDPTGGAVLALVRSLPTHPPPLAQWVEAPGRPGALRRAAAVLRCGRWDPERRRTAWPEAQAQLRCLAGEAAGAPAPYDLHPMTWAQAAHELGTPADAEPPVAADRPVYLALAEPAAAVVDAESGELLLAARLRRPVAASTNALRGADP